MGTSAFAKAASKLKKNWSTAQDDAKNLGGGDNCADGTFIFRLTGAKVMQVGDNDEWKLLTNWTVIAGDEKGSQCTKWDTLEREEGMKYTIAFLAALGIEDVDIAEMEETAKQLAKDKPIIRGRLKTNDAGFQNLRVLKVLDPDNLPDDVDADAGSGDDEDEKPSRSRKKGDDGGEIEKGSTVSFKIGKKKAQGVVKKIKGDTLTVETDDEIVEVELDEATLVEDEGGDEGDGDDAEIEKGSTVKFKQGKKTLEGTVKKIKGDAVTVTVDDEDFEVEKDDCELVEDEGGGDGDGDDEGFEVGDKVSFKHEKKSIIGKVTSVNAKKETLKVSAKGDVYELEFSEASKVADSE